MPALRWPASHHRNTRTLIAALIAILFPIAWISARSSEPIPPPGPNGIRVATYNIRAGLGGIRGITEDLKSLSADVIAIQEVERGRFGSKKIDQASTLADALGMKYVYAPSFSLEQREHGIAVLSRFPMSEIQRVELPQGTGRWPRVALKTRIETPAGPVRFVCVHLTRPMKMPFSHTRERMAQLRAIFASLEADSLPPIIAGDFNSTPFSPERWIISRHLQDSWTPWRDGWAFTFPLTSIGVPAGSVKIDAVYHDRSWRCNGTWVAPLGSSDHCPVVADVAPKARQHEDARARVPGRMRSS